MKTLFKRLLAACLCLSLLFIIPPFQIKPIQTLAESTSSSRSVFFNRYNLLENNIVSNIALGTTVASFKTGLSLVLGTSLVFKSQNGAVLLETDVLTTGSTIEATYNGSITIYTILILGDVNKDGLISIVDLAEIKSHLLKINTLTNIKMQSADLSFKNSVSISDLLAVKKSILNIAAINQDNVPVIAIAAPVDYTSAEKGDFSEYNTLNNSDIIPDASNAAISTNTDSRYLFANSSKSLKLTGSAWSVFDFKNISNSVYAKTKIVFNVCNPNNKDIRLFIYGKAWRTINNRVLTINVARKEWTKVEVPLEDIYLEQMKVAVVGEKAQGVYIDKIYLSNDNAIAKNLNANQWEDTWALGNMTATDNIADSSTNLAFTPADTSKRINTITAQKLDGLYISLTDIDYKTVGLPIMITPVRGGWSDSAGMTFVSASPSVIFYKGTGGTILKTLNKGANYIANHTRQGIYMYFYKQADGSFKYIINGVKDAEFVMTSSEVVAIFGSVDPEVYVSIGGGWYPPAGTNTSLKVRELSSDNSNRLLSYYDPYGRDAFVLSNGDMSGITYIHTGNHGAYAATAKSVQLDGLTFKYTNASAAEYGAVPLYFKLSIEPNGVMYDITKSNGLIFNLGASGDGTRYITTPTALGNAVAMTPTNFNNGIANTRPSEITVSVNKQANGNYKFTFTGNFTATGSVSVIYQTVSASEINTLFGAQPQIYLNFSSYDTRTIKIASITSINPATSVSLSKSSASIIIGQTETLNASISPFYATNKAVTWSSSNTSVATVSSGVVKALTAGTATITATTVDGSKTNTCNITVITPFAASQWEDTASHGNVAATDNISESSTTLTFNTAATTKRISMKSSQKLDGLQISLSNITYNPGTSAIRLPIMIAPYRGGWNDGAGMFCIAYANNIASNSTIEYREIAKEVTIAGAKSVLIKTAISKNTINYIPSHARQGMYMYFYKEADGSFKYIINGVRDAAFVMTSAEVFRMFGSYDPYVNVSIGGGYAPIAGKTTSLRVREISSENSNKLLSYWDTYSRDALVLETGDMSGITYTHTGNEGAYAATAKPMQLDGLSFKYTNAGVAEYGNVPLYFKIGTAPDGVMGTVSATNGIYCVANPDGTATTQSLISPTWGAIVQSSPINLSNGTTNTRPDELTISVAKQPNGDYQFTYTGNFTAGTNVITQTKTVTDILAIFGNSNPQVYLNFSAYDAHTIKIANITSINPVTSVSLNKSSTSLIIGQTEDFTSIVSPFYSTNENLLWSSSDTNIATVSSGIVTALIAGAATITVTTVDGSKTANCSVTVNNPVVSKLVSLIGDKKYEDGFDIIGQGASKGIVTGAFNYLNSSHSPSWQIGQWDSNFPWEDATNTNFVDKGNGVFRYDNPTKALEIDTKQGIMTIGCTSSNYWVTSDGLATNTVWPGIIAQTDLISAGNEQYKKVNNLKTVQVTLSERVTRFENQMRITPVEGLHAAQFLMYIVVQNRVIGDAGFGQMIWLGLTFFDNRYEVMGENAMFDEGTQQEMIGLGNGYFEGGEDYTWTNHKITASPNNEWSKINVNIIGKIQEAYNTASSLGYFSETSYDELSLTGMNIGWETPGTYDVEGQIKDLDILTELK